MPIMDGRTAAKEIRKLEATLNPRDDISSLRIDGRIPIFAVSASLYESDRLNLAQDFDGWLLKPLGELCGVEGPASGWYTRGETRGFEADAVILDFARVRALLAALQNPQKRSDEVYVQGHWERGGYLKGESALRIRLPWKQIVACAAIVPMHATLSRISEWW
jgi:CheY-like chemotaxis protein